MYRRWYDAARVSDGSPRVANTAMLQASTDILTRAALGSSLDVLRRADWEDLDAIASSAHALLEGLDRDRATVATLLTAAANDARLLELCERLAWCRKITIYEDALGGFRLRLHLFIAGYADRPHSHRWSFGSRILSGAYRHTLWGLDTGVVEGPMPRMAPCTVRLERAGAAYVLHHTAIHSFADAEPRTVSLVLRGPTIKDRAAILDGATRTVAWKYGAAKESSAYRDGTAVTAADIAAANADLVSWGVLPRVV